MKKTLSFSFAFSLLTSTLFAAADLTTVSEKSKWVKTGRYNEVIRLCKDFEKTYPKQVRCHRFGTSPEGRAMMDLVLSEGKDPKKKPVVLFQGGIHSGEIDGKDAGFLFIRNILEKKELPGVLSKVTLVFVPVFSVDAHERFGPNNRPNQVGPEEMGWRTTSQNLNLNRDYMKADAPEMQAMLRLLNEWDPILYIDLHVTDGAQFQHDIAPLIYPSRKGPIHLAELGTQVQTEMNQKLTQKGNLPVDFYPDLAKADDPTGGFKVDVMTPRFSTGYWPLHNRLSLLVETHSWKDYAARVKSTYNTLQIVTEMAERDGANWLKIAAETDREAPKIAGQNVDLAWDTTDHFKTIDFLGYEYTREMSPISGALAIHYNPQKPQVWKVPLFDELKSIASATAPANGYIVPAAHAAWMKEKLKLHGVKFEVLKTGNKPEEVEVFRATKADFEKTPFEGRTQLKVVGTWAKEKRAISDGSLFVPIHQPKAYLVMHLLEPAAPDSFLSWGFFNAHFEKKEYMENYVAEDVAKGMLDKDLAVRTEFKKKLDSEPEFAKSPDDRLEFFYRKHPSWDERYNMYPVFRK